MRFAAKFQRKSSNAKRKPEQNRPLPGFFLYQNPAHEAISSSLLVLLLLGIRACAYLIRFGGGKGAKWATVEDSTGVPTATT